MAFLVKESLQMNVANTPLDARATIATIADITKISKPNKGLIFYVEDEDRYYRVLTLKSKQNGLFTEPNAAIDSYEFVFGTPLTYTLETIPNMVTYLSKYPSADADALGYEGYICVKAGFKTTRNRVANTMYNNGEIININGYAYQVTGAGTSSSAETAVVSTTVGSISTDGVMTVKCLGEAGILKYYGKIFELTAPKDLVYVENI